MREFRDYLKYARKYLLMAEDVTGKQENADWLLIPAIILAWSAIESFVNNRCDELSYLPSDLFELHERAFLQEKRLRFKESGADIGKFVLEGNEYQNLENKIFFLLAKMGSRNTTNLKGGELWQRFQTLKDVRDCLAHPRRYDEIDLQTQAVSTHIETAQEVIQVISKRIWNTELDFP